MPLTGANGASEIDPYELTEEELAAGAVEEATQEGEEETAQQIADGSEPVEEPEPVEEEYVQLSASELAEMQKKLAHQESHIGRLEGENKGLRTVTETFPKPSAPEPTPAPTSVFDDEGTRSLIRQAMEEDPLEAMLLIAKYNQEQTNQQIANAVTPIQQQSVQQQQLSQYQQMINQELLQAAQQLPGGQQIVEEYAQMQGQGGRLAEKILRRGQALKNMGVDPQVAVAPGAFRAAIAEILMESGGAPVAASAPAGTGARPKARSVPSRTPKEPANASEDDIYADNIVKAEKAREKMAKILS